MLSSSSFLLLLLLLFPSPAKFKPIQPNKPKTNKKPLIPRNYQLNQPQSDPN
ncbi:hypothetical protein JHK85_053596 [Glycine max]|uniref:Uncharacterized protein n=1 Tax=Glycine soja TaxID=3848 RepID=A0A0B2RAC1_GLYSO|nr:hypothetical protein JHK86_052743 [Glycine max]KAG4927110.1 hypothetical protein JHK85_053596 [Glycine max]KHN30495.1 hypothetical protein glysoja_041115 [Glycine soja]